MRIKEFYGVHKTKILKSLYLLFLNLAILCLLLIIWGYFQILDVSLIISFNWLFGIVVFSLLIAFISKYNLDLYDNRESQTIDTIFQVSPYFFLAILIVLALNQFLKLDFLLDRNIHLVILGIAFGFLAFYKNRDRIEQEIEDEKNQEELAEKRRADQFAFKFPRINRIWGLRWIVKWMYKEGGKYILFLIVLIIYASIIIFQNLGSHNLYHDEQWHIQVIKSLEEGQGFRLWNYISNSSMMKIYDGRIIDYITYFLVTNFGHKIFLYRLTPAIFGVLLIPLIYIVFRGFFSKPISILVALGFTVNINALYLARFLRPYTISLFFYLISFYLFYLFFLYKDKGASVKSILSLLFFSLTFAILSIEEREIGKMLLILMPIFLLVYLFGKREFLLKKINIIFIIILFLFFIVFLLIDYLKIIQISILYNQFNQFISLNKIINPTNIYYDYLFEKYIKIPFVFYSGFILGCFYLLGDYYNSKEPSRSILLFYTIVPLIMIVYLLNRYYDPRYCYFFVPFVYAISIYGLYLLSFIYLKNKKIKNACFILIISIFLFYPIVPNLQVDGLTLKAPGDWLGGDASLYWHYRGVPQDWDIAIPYINNVTTEGDIVIFGEGDYGGYLISPRKEIDYYGVTLPYRFTQNLTNIRYFNKSRWEDYGNTDITFTDLMKSRGNRSVYYVGFSFVDKDPIIPSYLLSNCEDLSPRLGVKQFQERKWMYSSEFYWPSIFKCVPE